MGFYFRKSIGVGPFRFNLSKSGIGVSTGIPGFRISQSPTGTYIHLGKNGFYYKQKIGFNPKATHSQIKSEPENYESFVSQEYSKTHGPMSFIGTSSIDGMVNAKPDSILNEIKEKSEIQELWPIVFIISFTISLIVLLAEKFLYLRILTIAFSILITVWFFINDSLKKCVVLMYDIDDEYLEDYKNLCNEIEDFSHIKKLWVINTAGAVHDSRYHAGANLLITRSIIKINYSTPKNIKVNVSVPQMDLGRIQLFLLPSEIL
ncbi:MAG: DUF4236 domain-containing protein, partial [Isosphaeraceae bacterium]